MATTSPPIMIRKENGKPVPASHIDAELFDSYSDGEQFRMVYASRRSNPQNSLYWVMLNRIVDATDKWPSSDKLHKTLLIETGHFTPVVSLDGKSVRLEADSAAFQSMNSAAFKNYFDRAVKLLADNLGFDPLEFYHEDAA